jgi:RNA polymerase sigma-70 factor (ECF subfamily)
MMEDSDAAVVQRVREGDRNAFRALVERHSHALFRLAYRMTGNEHDAEDVVQETFLRAFRHLNRFKPEGHFAAWLHRIAVNCAINLLQKRRPPVESRQAGIPLSTDALDTLAASTPTPDRAAIHAELQQKVQAALGRLSPGERIAFVLRHFEGRSIEEIRAVLGVGTSAAKQFVFRGVQKVRRELEPFLNPSK